MKLKNIAAALIISVCTLIPVSSELTSLPFSSCAYNNACGLIEKCSVNCTGEDGLIKITAKTQASGTMDNIGFTDIIIQKSTDQVNWSNEKNIGDFLESGKKYYTLNHSEDVTGGFYYRIVCTHYAEGIPFGKNDSEIQTAENISKIIWIEKSDEPAPTSETTTESTSISHTTSTTLLTSSTTSKDSDKTENSVTYSSENSENTTLKITSSTKSAESSKYTSISTRSGTNMSYSSTSKTTKTTESSQYSDNSVNTGVNLPVSAFVMAFLAAVSVMIFRRKSK